MIKDDIIAEVVRTSGLAGYSGVYEFIGHGEINDTYRIETADGPVVLRIAKYSGATSLIVESEALKLVDLPNAPKLLYFDKSKLVDGRHWILESYVQGNISDRLTRTQFYNLGKLLAAIHEIKDPSTNQLNIWQHLLECSSAFGDEKYFFKHPDMRLRRLLIKGKHYLKSQQHHVDGVKMTLIHSDATPSNILVNGDSVVLIDWEFARYSDPMREFSMVFYEDIDYNKGKWRIKITKDEKQALYDGYTEAGGHINKKRIKFWMNFDKLSAALFLYWRVYESKSPVPVEGIAQYNHDLDSLIGSLEKHM